MTTSYGFQDILSREKIRYKTHVLPYIVALFVGLFIIAIVPSYINLVFRFWSFLDTPYLYFLMLTFAYFPINLSVTLFTNYIYKAKSPLFEQYRYDNKQWQWEYDIKGWKELVASVKKAKRSNFLIGMSMFVLISGKLQFWRADIESTPGHFEIISQLTLCLLSADFISYWMHRWLHHPKVYFLHKTHHEFTQVSNLSASYSHPLDYLSLGLFSTMFCPILLGSKMHLGTFCCWTILRQIVNIDSHLGYELPWFPFRLLPFTVLPEYHSYHHSHNIGNFSNFLSIWDTLCGTNVSYYTYKDKLVGKAK